MGLLGEGKARLDLKDSGTSVRGLAVVGDNTVRGSTGGESIAVDNDPIELFLSTSIVAENTPVGSGIATLSATGPGTSFTYALVNDHSGVFRIEGNILYLSKALDYEAVSSLPIRIAVMDGFG